MVNEEILFISCLLNKPSELEAAASKIKPEYLQDSFCRSIYEAMLELGTYSTPVLAKHLNINISKLIEIEGHIVIFIKLQFEGYCYVIFENYKHREIKRLATQEEVDIERLNELQNLTFFEEPAVDESDEFLKNVQDRYEGKSDNRNIKTGFFAIDSKIGGFRYSEAIFIGGRPGSGKTSLGLNIAYNIAKEKKTVLFFSLEMGRIELHDRLVKSITKINNYEKMTQEDFYKVIKTSRAIKERLPLKVFDKAGMTLEDIFYKAKKEKQKDAIIIDHLSILHSRRYFKSKYEEVSYISGKIKELARLLDIPVICLCQLNRALESRDLKAPTMADIRDSGTVEQDGDIIAFVYRPEYHLKDKEPDDKNSKAHSDWEEKMNEVRGKAQFIIAKNRRGFVGRVNLGFDGKNYIFYDIE